MRSWADVVRKNPDAIWIINGQMCEDLRMNGNRVREPWNIVGFNGCWSCDRMMRCERVMGNEKNR